MKSQIISDLRDVQLPHYRSISFCQLGLCLSARYRKLGFGGLNKLGVCFSLIVRKSQVGDC